MNKKALPKFASEEEERVFWADNDSTDYVDWSNAQNALFPNLKPEGKNNIIMPYGYGTPPKQPPPVT